VIKLIEALSTVEGLKRGYLGVKKFTEVIKLMEALSEVEGSC
jgi:hypothetical protein